MNNVRFIIIFSCTLINNIISYIHKINVKMNIVRLPHIWFSLCGCISNMFFYLNCLRQTHVPSSRVNFNPRNLIIQHHRFARVPINIPSLLRFNRKICPQFFLNKQTPLLWTTFILGVDVPLAFSVSEFIVYRGRIYINMYIFISVGAYIYIYIGSHSLAFGYRWLFVCARKSVIGGWFYRDNPESRLLIYIYMPLCSTSVARCSGWD